MSHNQMTGHVQMTESEQHTLYLRFERLMQRLLKQGLLSASQFNADIKSHLWQNIQTRYSEPHRYYHNLRHIKQMFKAFTKVQDKLHQLDVVALTIWYHDIIYDTKLNFNQASNEVQSADFFAGEYKSYLPAEFIKQVEAMILATERHQLPTTLTPNQISDTKYFLDMDLAILGQPWADYERYTKQVRLEYRHVPLDSFKAERATILNNFLQRERLYFTDTFFDELEQQARTNIKKEQSLLRNYS